MSRKPRSAMLGIDRNQAEKLREFLLLAVVAAGLLSFVMLLWQ